MRFNRVVFLTAVWITIPIVSGTLAQDTATSTLEPSASVTMTPTATLTETPPATPTGTPTPIPSASLSPTPTMTWTSTWTPVIQTVIVPVTVPSSPNSGVVVNVGSSNEASNPSTATSASTQPPVPSQPPPPPTLMTPFYGWRRYESNHLINVIGSWGIVRDRDASWGGYRESASAAATLRYPFEGDGLLIVYRAHPDGGEFDMRIDGVSQGIVSAYAPEPGFYQAGPFFFQNGYHVLDIVALADISGITSIAIDYVDVFFGPPAPATRSPSRQDGSETGERHNVAAVELVSMPPTAVPTPTPLPPAVVSVDVVVAYDENVNRQADLLTEGVYGISVRVVDAVTNTLLASGITDERGTLQLQVLAVNDITVFIPVLNQRRTIRPTPGQEQTFPFEVLIEAENLPGLIP